MPEKPSWWKIGALRMTTPKVAIAPVPNFSNSVYNFRGQLLARIVNIAIFHNALLIATQPFPDLPFQRASFALGYPLKTTIDYQDLLKILAKRSFWLNPGYTFKKIKLIISVSLLNGAISKTSMEILSLLCSLLSVPNHSGQVEFPLILDIRSVEGAWHSSIGSA